MNKIKLNIQRFAQSTTFSEGNVNVQANTSSLTINISFSSPSSSTWFNGKTLSCTCDGQTQSTLVSLSRGGSVNASFTFYNIPHDVDGGRVIGWSWSCATGTSALGTVSDSGTLRLVTIPRYAITNSVSGSDIEGNFSVNYTSYTNIFTYKLRISIPSVKQLEKFNYSNNSTFKLSNDTINYLQTYMKNSNNVNLGFAVETWSGSTLLSSGNEKIITCKITNANPIFSDFAFEDINPTTLALTGNNSINIKGYSNIQVTISPENKATAQKGATMSKYRFINDTQSVEIPYNDTQSVSGVITKTTTGTFVVYAIDSRNNATSVTKLASNDISYEPIIINLTSSVERDKSGVGTNCTLKYSGSFWNKSFGQVTNSIKSAVYKFKKTEESEWKIGTTDITPTINEDGTFSFEGSIKSNNDDYSWDIQSSYNVVINLTDELSNVSLELTPLNSGRPNISLDDNGVGIMCAYDDSIGGLLQVGGIPISNYDLVCLANVNNISIQSGNFNLNKFSTINILNSNCFIEENGELICKKSGYYRITQMVRMSDGSGNCFNGIAINNNISDNNGVWLQNSKRLTICFSQILNLNSNDNIKFINQGTTVSNLGISNGKLWFEYMKPAESTQSDEGENDIDILSDEPIEEGDDIYGLQ